ncbi:MAG TPA: acetoacetate decarboxylase family protein [Marmoricola sp.]|nr:acetoacetate decarboxylase family protein [Marmoricola sp.]
MSSTAHLAGVPGVPETLLSQALLATLPDNLAPAPWSCTCDAVLWFGRGGAAATAALAPALRRRGLGVVAGMVRYHETPVGRYDEVFGVVGSHTGPRPRGSVVFMAVDSPASLVGGRTNWGLPKTLAAFEGGVAGGATFTARGVDDVRWRVAASPRVLGPASPVVAGGQTRQVFPDGRVGGSRLSARGRAHPAVVTVEVDSDGPLASWLRPGRHLGAVVRDTRFTLH